MSDSETKISIRYEYFNTDHLKSDLKKRSVRGAGVTVFSRISIYCIQMISTIVLARILTPDDFGLIAMIAVFSGILIEFGMLRLSDVTIQREIINHKQISTLFWINVVLCVALTLLLMAVSPLIARFYKEPRLELITIVIALSFIFNGLSVQHLALLQRNMQFYKFAINQIVATTISSIIAIILALLGHGYWALVVRYIGLPMITSVGAWILCRWRPGPPAMGTGVRSMLKFGINSLGSYTMNYFCRSFDKVLIGWYYGPQPLGYYDRAYHLFVMPVNQLTYPLTSVAVATLSRLCNEPEQYRSYYLNAVSMLAFVGILLSAILTLIGNDFIILLLGSQWSTAGKIFTVFGPGIGIMLIYSTNGWLHLSLGRADRWFRWSIIAFIITCLCFIIGLPFGAFGVAIAYTTSFYLLIGPGLWYAGKPIGLKLSSIVSVIWKYYLSALSAGLLSWFILYSYDLTSKLFISLNVLLRILVPTILLISIYLILIVVFYQSLKPITQFISTLHDMLPRMQLKTSRR